MDLQSQRLQRDGVMSLTNGRGCRAEISNGSYVFLSSVRFPNKNAQARLNTIVLSFKSIALVPREEYQE